MAKRKRAPDARSVNRNRFEHNAILQQHFDDSAHSLPSYNDFHAPNSGRRIIYDEDGNIERSYTLYDNETPSQRPQKLSAGHVTTTVAGEGLQRIDAKTGNTNTLRTHRSRRNRYEEIQPEASISNNNYRTTVREPNPPTKPLAADPSPRGDAADLFVQKQSKLPVLIPVPSDEHSQRRQDYNSQSSRGRQLPFSTFSSSRSQYGMPKISVEKDCNTKSGGRIIDITDLVSDESIDTSDSTTSSSDSESASGQSRYYNTGVEAPSTQQNIRSSTTPKVAQETSQQRGRNESRSQSVPNREELQAAAEKTINTAGNRLKEQDQKTGERFTTGLESRLLSNLSSVIPEHILATAKHHLANDKTATKSKKSQTAANRNKADPGFTNEAVILRAAKDLILTLSAQKIAKDLGNSQHKADPGHAVTNERDILSGQGSNNVIQNELTRIVRQKDDRIGLLELELYNYRQKSMRK